KDVFLISVCSGFLIQINRTIAS
ncbi:hypothetical protein A5875_003886, partial [Enterococcus sp. 3H8_DIV0648]